MGQKILIIEDTKSIRDILRINAEKHGYSVQEAYDGPSGLEKFQEDPPDLILLDVLLPGLSGLDVCRWIRQTSKVPIIVISAKKEESVKVAFLNAGADDYVTKPFGPDELIARLRAVLRRTSEFPTVQLTTQIAIQDLVIDLNLQTVSVEGVDVRLTKLEFDLLRVLAFNPDCVVSRETLLERIWGDDFLDYTHYLHIHIGRIRKKLGTRYGGLIRTLQGVGYRLSSKFTDSEAPDDLDADIL